MSAPLVRLVRMNIVILTGASASAENAMGIKSRSNYRVSVCFRECINRDVRCGECIRFSHFHSEVPTPARSGKERADEKGKPAVSDR